MPDISFDPAEAQNQLRRLITQNQEQAAAHRAQYPAFPAASAGQAFSGYATRIQTALQHVHDCCSWRWDNLAATATAAAEQLRALEDLDGDSASRLAHVQPEREGGI